jgi:2-amino-4-hydroxy-6-hydroxymethyldihydropteridine diphosphokinase
MQPGASAVTAYVGLGSNLDHPQRQLLEACEALSHLPRTQLVRRSSFYRSAPVGKTDQPDFVNAVAALRTELAPAELLQALLWLEAQQGRVRSVPNAARTLDLDLLLFDARVIHEPGLDVPHPRMHERAFVLVPLAELDPKLNIPGRGTVADLLPLVAGQDVARVDAQSE